MASKAKSKSKDDSSSSDEEPNVSKEGAKKRERSAHEKYWTDERDKLLIQFLNEMGNDYAGIQERAFPDAPSSQTVKNRVTHNEPMKKLADAGIRSRIYLPTVQ